MPKARPNKTHPDTKYKPEFVETVEKLGLMGMSQSQMAAFFDVHEQTIIKWRRQHEDFGEAYNRGKDIADANVAKALYQRAVGYEHEDTDIRVCNGEIVQTPILKHYPPETPAAIHWLVNRQPDKWKRANDIPDHQPEMPTMSDVELARRIIYILTSAAGNATDQKG